MPCATSPYLLDQPPPSTKCSLTPLHDDKEVHHEQEGLLCRHNRIGNGGLLTNKGAFVHQQMNVMMIDE